MNEAFKYRPEHPVFSENGIVPERYMAAHKRGMLELARDAYDRGDLPNGVFVPKLFSSLDKAVAEGNPFWMRGYLPHFVDGFAVDALSTEKIEIEKRYATADNQEYAEIMHREIVKKTEALSRQNVGFFERNFGVNPGSPEFFFQADASPKDAFTSHISVITDPSNNTYIFDVSTSPTPPRGAGSFQITARPDGDPVIKVGSQTRDDYHGVAQIFTDTGNLGKVDAIIGLYNDCLDRTDLCYKLDLQVVPSNNFALTLIQARVVTQGPLEKPEARKKIDNMTEQGVESIRVEMGHLVQTLNRLRDPAILSLHHSQQQLYHLDTSLWQFEKFDKIAGVVVPQCFDRGLLSHGGYGVVAYANWWGLPLVFDQ